MPKIRYAVFSALAAPVLGYLAWLVTKNEKAALIVAAVVIFGVFVPLAIAYFALRGRAARRVFEAYAVLRDLEFEPGGGSAGHGVVDPGLWVDYSCSGSFLDEEILVVRAIGERNTPPSWTFVRFTFQADHAAFPAVSLTPRGASEDFDRIEESTGLSDYQHVYMESDAFNQRFELFAGPGQDPVDVHRLFTPSFVLWLTEAAPPRLGFDVVEGILTCTVRGYRLYRQSAVDTIVQLDALVIAGVGVAKRLREESAEASRGDVER